MMIGSMKFSASTSHLSHDAQLTVCGYTLYSYVKPALLKDALQPETGHKWRGHVPTVLSSSALIRLARFWYVPLNALLHGWGSALILHLSPYLIFL